MAENKLNYFITTKCCMFNVHVLWYMHAACNRKIRQKKHIIKDI